MGFTPPGIQSKSFERQREGLPFWNGAVELLSELHYNFYLRKELQENFTKFNRVGRVRKDSVPTKICRTPKKRGATTFSCGEY